jgi:hypothetical protein
MSGAIPPFPQYALMAWCSVKAQGQLHFYLLPLKNTHKNEEMEVNVNVKVKVKLSLCSASLSSPP